MSGAMIFLAADLVVLAPPRQLSVSMIREIQEQWRAATDSVRLIVLAEPVELLDLRAHQVFDALDPELQALVYSLLEVAP